MRLHRGRIRREEIQNVPTASEFMQCNLSDLLIEACFQKAKKQTFRPGVIDSSK
tara:strand:- start:1532 stop:1693 length:162 start_codon:yes stop_codon:yes gene_type:complete